MTEEKEEIWTAEEVTAEMTEEVAVIEEAAEREEVVAADREVAVDKAAEVELVAVAEVVVAEELVAVEEEEVNKVSGYWLPVAGWLKIESSLLVIPG